MSFCCLYLFFFLLSTSSGTCPCLCYVVGSIPCSLGLLQLQVESVLKLTLLILCLAICQVNPWCTLPRSFWHVCALTLEHIDEVVINEAVKHLRGICGSAMDSLSGPNYNVSHYCCLVSDTWLLHLMYSMHFVSDAWILHLMYSMHFMSDASISCTCTCLWDA